MNQIPAWAWTIGLTAVIGFIVWVAKKVLWEPLAELKAAQAHFVTETEVDMQVQELNRKMDALRRERDEGEGRILRDFETMRRENATQRNEIRQDVRALVQRIDTVMQQARH